MGYFDISQVIVLDFCLFSFHCYCLVAPTFREKASHYHYQTDIITHKILPLMTKIPPQELIEIN